LNFEPLNGFFRSYFPLVPLAVPQWSRETYRAMARCLISGRVVDGPDLAKLKEEIVNTLGVADAALCGSGSLALEWVLRVCGVRSGDEVVIPTFCCTAVVPPILAVGATPVLADVGEELNVTAATVEAVLTRKTRAVVVPHLFGNPAEIDAIVNLVCEKNICVIDDAAQALGAAIDGQAVGSFGDAGVLSFGSEKVCFGLGGGAIVSRRKEVCDAISRFKLSMPDAAPAIEKFLSTLIWRRFRRWTSPLRSLMPRNGIVAPDSPPAPYLSGAMTNLSAAVAVSLMLSLSENIAARRARVELYHELLGNTDGIELIPHGAGSACLTQVIRVLPKRRDDDLASQLINALGAAGYEVRGSYVPIHLLRQFERCVWDRLPYAERVWPDLVELPCEPSVSMDDVERIAMIVKKITSGR
jgi:dTDP-4-amino-4,6-dideoxygalactose transaminase